MFRAPFYRQQKHFTCGPAVLRMALAAHGRRLTEAYLTKKCETSARHGSSNFGLMRCLRSMGVSYITEYRARYRDLGWYLRKGIVIVDWMPQLIFPDHPEFAPSPQYDPDEDAHYAIVVSAGEIYITLQDPVLGRRIRVRRSEFVRAWRDPTSQTAHWVMVVQPPGHETQ